MFISMLLLGSNVAFVLLMWQKEAEQLKGVLTPVVSFMTIHQTCGCANGHVEPDVGSGACRLVMYLQIPGVNVPSSHIGYYLVALVVSGVLHEFGHGIAASRYAYQPIPLHFIEWISLGQQCAQKPHYCALIEVLF